MGFNYMTLLSLPLGLLLPVAVLVYMFVSRKKKAVAFDSFFIGFGAFLASVAAVAVVFVLANTLFLSGLVFSDDTSGMTVVGAIIAMLIISIYVVCESFKMSAIKKFKTAETPRELSGIGFSAGVVAAQNIVEFVALNIFSHYEMTYGYALFSGAILLFTGIMYTVLSISCEVILSEGYKGPAYALSSVYYLFWLSAVGIVSTGTSEKTSILLYIVSAFIFILSFVLSGVFVFKFKKSSKVK